MRLRQQIAATADPIPMELLAELEAYPEPASARDEADEPAADYGGVVVPFRLRTTRRHWRTTGLRSARRVPMVKNRVCQNVPHCPMPSVA